MINGNQYTGSYHGHRSHINKAMVKKTALAYAYDHQTRGRAPGSIATAPAIKTRVSHDFIAWLEYEVDRLIKERVRHHDNTTGRRKTLV